MEVAEKLLKLIHQGKIRKLDYLLTYRIEYNDFRYFITNDKLAALGWKQEVGFDQGLAKLCSESFVSNNDETKLS